MRALPRPAIDPEPTTSLKAGIGRWWLWSAALLILAGLATVQSAIHTACLLDRSAVATGEWWRLWTGHLAHFSAGHLLVDATLLALLVGASFHSGERRLDWVLVLGAPSLSLMLLAGDADLARYGGLSGLNALLAGRLGLGWLTAPDGPRLAGLTLLLGATGKFGLDSLGLANATVDFGAAEIRTCHLSHWLGLALGLLMGLALPPTGPVSSPRASRSSPR